MTEDQIERIAERKMDALDKRLLAGEITQAEYDSLVYVLDQWVKDQAKPAKRYQVIPHAYQLGVYYVWDSWTKCGMGHYPTKPKAQARARTLNSRNGGK